MSSSRIEYPTIDVLRGFAAYSVILLHTIVYGNWTDFPRTGLLSWFRIGDRSVDLFFVISGFVIFLSARDLWLRFGWAYLPRFALRRLARIAPLHWLTCLVALLTIDAAVLSRGDLAQQLTTHFLFIHSLASRWFSTINGVSWSISIEMQFYVLIALLTPVLMRVPGVVILIVGTLAAWAWRWHAFQSTPLTDTLYNYHLFVGYSQLPGALDLFCFGIALAKFMTAPAAALLSRRRIAILVPVVAIILFYLFVFPGAVSYPDLQAAIVFRKTGFAAAFAAAVLCAVVFSVPKLSPLTRVPRYAGTISYGLYLWHLPILLSLSGRGLPPLQLCGIVLAGTTIVAAISHRVFERPISDAARHWEERWRGRQAAPAPA